MSELFDNEHFRVDEEGIYFKPGCQTAEMGAAHTVVMDDSTSHITICGGAGVQVKSIIGALRRLADALDTLIDVGVEGEGV